MTGKPLDRQSSMARPPKTHCRNGHEYTTVNTYVSLDGKRFCRTCRKHSARLNRWKYLKPCSVCGGPTGREKYRPGSIRCLACVKAEREAVHAARMAARAQVDPTPPEDEVKPLIKSYRKAVLPADLQRLGDRQKAIVRLLRIAPKPLSAKALSAVLARLPRKWIGVEYSGLLCSLRALEKKGIVARVACRPRSGWKQGEPQFAWLVRAGKAITDAPLTLDDALRERELALLIAEQEREISRGEWAEVDFRTRSLDAPFSVDGGTFHDLLEDRT